MALNTQIFQRTNDQENEARKSNSSKKKRHTHLHSKRKPKEYLKQSSQSHYNSHFNLNKQAYTQHEAALQKEQSDAPCNFMKLIIPI